MFNLKTDRCFIITITSPQRSFILLLFFVFSHLLSFIFFWPLFFFLFSQVCVCVRVHQFQIVLLLVFMLVHTCIRLHSSFFFFCVCVFCFHVVFITQGLIYAFCVCWAPLELFFYSSLLLWVSVCVPVYLFFYSVCFFLFSPLSYYSIFCKLRDC